MLPLRLAQPDLDPLSLPWNNAVASSPSLSAFGLVPEGSCSICQIMSLSPLLRTLRSSHLTQSKSQNPPVACKVSSPPCPHLLLLPLWLPWLQPHWPLHCSSNAPGIVMPQDLCTGYPSASSFPLIHEAHPIFPSVSLSLGWHCPGLSPLATCSH